jgi:peroxiredoxin
MDSNRSPLSAKTTQVVGLLLIIALTVSTLLLAFENRKLKNQMESMVQPRDVLKRGDTLAVIEVRTLEDSIYQVVPRTDSAGRLFVLLSTTCPACERSIPMLKDIVRHAQVNGFDVLFVSIHDRVKTVAFIEKHGLALPIYIAADSLSKAQLKANAVPQTLLVSPNGIVWNNWVGLIDSVKQIEIVDSLHAKMRLNSM